MERGEAGEYARDADADADADADGRVKMKIENYDEGRET